jgi:hypothetical protein
MKGLLVVLTTATTLAGGAVWAQEQAQEQTEVNTGQDPTKPLTRLDLRYQYQNAPPGDHDNVHIITPRVDKPFVLAPAWSLATRLDLPLFITDGVSADNQDGDYTFGLGDLLIQALLINAPTPRFGWAAGAQAIFPTATEDLTGSGKYRIVPTLGARYTLPEVTKGTFFAMVARYDTSVAGDDDRRDIDELQLGPLFHLQLPDLWFVDLYPSTDIRYNAGDKRPGDTGRWFVPLNVMVGKMLNPRTVTSIEVGVPIIDDYQVYDFKVEARVGFFF